MVIAMMILGVGTLGLSAWIALVVARSGVVDGTEAAISRRVRLENSKQLAREWVYRKMVGESSGAGVSETVPDGWGQITAPSFAVSYLGTQTKAPFNRTSPMPSGAFGASIDVVVGDGIGTNTGRFFINSIHPALAGDLLVVYDPPAGYTPNSVTGDLRVKGRAILMSQEALGHNFKAQRVIFPIATGATPAISDFGGNTLVPDNYPFAPVTTGLVGGNPGWGGELNVVNNADNTENSLYHKVAAGDHAIIDGLAVQGDPTSAIFVPGDGTVHLTLGSGDMTNVIVSQNVTEVILIGQVGAVESGDAAALPAVSIVVLDPAVVTVTCSEENHRALVLGIKSDTFYRAVALNFAASVGFPRWKMVSEIENVMANVSVGGTAAQIIVVGGIRCNAGLSVATGSAPLILEQDPDLGELGAALPRHAWVESYVRPGS